MQTSGMLQDDIYLVWMERASVDGSKVGTFLVCPAGLLAANPASRLLHFSRILTQLTTMYGVHVVQVGEEYEDIATHQRLPF